MKTILITGINGFIGEYLGKKFIKYNNIIGIDSRENKRNNWNKFYHFDIRNKNKMEMIFRENKIDIVIHLAAEKTLIKCQENKKEAYKGKVNVTTKTYIDPQNQEFARNEILFNVTSKDTGNSNHGYDVVIDNLPENAIINRVDYITRPEEKRERSKRCNSTLQVL